MITVDISKVKINQRNPRKINNSDYEYLLKSLKEFPEMLQKRPIVCVSNDDGTYTVLGGNMRLKACQSLNIKQIPIILADDWNEKQRKEFIIKDNLAYGDWDFELLADGWDAKQLEEWGLFIPTFETEPSFNELVSENKNKPATMKITFENPEQLQNAVIDIEQILTRKYPKAYFSISAGEI